MKTLACFLLAASASALDFQFSFGALPGPAPDGRGAPTAGGAEMARMVGAMDPAQLEMMPGMPPQVAQLLEMVGEMNQAQMEMMMQQGPPSPPAVPAPDAAGMPPQIAQMFDMVDELVNQDAEMSMNAARMARDPRASPGVMPNVIEIDAPPGVTGPPPPEVIAEILSELAAEGLAPPPGGQVEIDFVVGPPLAGDGAEVFEDAAAAGPELFAAPPAFMALQSFSGTCEETLRAAYAMCRAAAPAADAANPRCEAPGQDDADDEVDEAAGGAEVEYGPNVGGACAAAVAAAEERLAKCGDGPTAEHTMALRGAEPTYGSALRLLQDENICVCGGVVGRHRLAEVLGLGCRFNPVLAGLALVLLSLTLGLTHRNVFRCLERRAALRAQLTGKPGGSRCCHFLAAWPLALLVLSAMSLALNCMGPLLFVVVTLMLLVRRRRAVLVARGAGAGAAVNRVTVVPAAVLAEEEAGAGVVVKGVLVAEEAPTEQEVVVVGRVVKC